MAQNISFYSPQAVELKFYLTVYFRKVLYSINVRISVAYSVDSSKLLVKLAIQKVNLNYIFYPAVVAFCVAKFMSVEF